MVLTAGFPGDEPVAGLWLLVVSCRSPRAKQDGAWAQQGNMDMDHQPVSLGQEVARVGE